MTELQSLTLPCGHQINNHFRITQNRLGSLVIAAKKHARSAAVETLYALGRDLSCPGHCAARAKVPFLDLWQRPLRRLRVLNIFVGGFQHWGADFLASHKVAYFRG